jgi:hypothetical protein
MHRILGRIGIYYASRFGFGLLLLDPQGRGCLKRRERPPSQRRCLAEGNRVLRRDIQRSAWGTFYFACVFRLLIYWQTRDRTEEVRAIVEQYERFDFLPLRIEDAFDDAWWQKVGGQRPESHLSVDLANEGVPHVGWPDESTNLYSRPNHVSAINIIQQSC